MDNLLIHEVGKELDGGLAQKFIVPAVRLFELGYHSVYHQADHVRQLGVDCGKQSCIHVGEGRGCHLRFHYCPSQEALATHQVFVKQLHDDVRNVGHVDFVYHSVDRLAKLLPHVLLVSFTVLAFASHFFQQGSHLEWRHIDATH